MSSFNREAYDRARSRLEVARNDLEELDQQVEDGEIDQVTAADLRSGYEAELKSAEAALAAAGTPPTKPESKKQPEAPAKPATKKRAPSESLEKAPAGGGWNKRILVGGGILIAAVVFIIFSVQSSSEPDPTAGPPLATGGDASADPCADLAAALNDHVDNGFRLALANCYLSTGQAMSAIEHYRTVLEGEDSTAEEASEGAWGLGIMNYQIGRLDESESYLRQALELNPDNPDAKFYLGMILVYDLGRGDEAIPLLEDFLAFPGIPPEMAADVEAALEVARGDGAGS